MRDYWTIDWVVCYGGRLQLVGTRYRGEAELV